MDEDQIIKNRLLTDEKALRRAIGKYTLWSKALTDGGDTCTKQAMLLMHDLSGLEHQARRQLTVLKMHGNEVHRYTDQYADIQHMIDKTRQEIGRLKHDLADAKQERQNKLAYDALAEQLLPFATRDETQQRLERMRVHREKLDKMYEAQEALIRVRKIHLHDVFRLMNAKRQVLADERPFHENAYEFDDDEDVHAELKQVQERLDQLNGMLETLPPLPEMQADGQGSTVDETELADKNESDAMDTNG